MFCIQPKPQWDRRMFVCVCRVSCYLSLNCVSFSYILTAQTKGDDVNGIRHTNTNCHMWIVCIIIKSSVVCVNAGWCACIVLGNSICVYCELDSCIFGTFRNAAVLHRVFRSLHIRMLMMFIQLMSQWAHFQMSYIHHLQMHTFGYTRLTGRICVCTKRYTKYSRIFVRWNTNQNVECTWNIRGKIFGRSTGQPCCGLDGSNLAQFNCQCLLCTIYEAAWIKENK